MRKRIFIFPIKGSQGAYNNQSNSVQNTANNKYINNIKKND